MTEQQLPITALKRNPGQPRKEEKNVKGLALSIANVGLIEPILVAKHGDDYVIMSGHRRLAAVKQLGWTDVPCRIEDDPSKIAELASLIAANVVREDFTDIEKAQGYQAMLDLGLTTEAIAKTVAEEEELVQRYVAVADGNSTLTKLKKEAPGLTLEEMEAVTQATMWQDRIPKGLQEILDTIGSEQFGHAYARLRTAINDAIEVDNIKAEHPDLRFIESSMIGYNTDEPMLLDSLGIKPEDHEDCPGHCGSIVGWSKHKLMYCCDQPKLHPKKAAERSPHEQERLDKLREGRTFKSEMRAPTQERRKWIKEVLLVKDTEKIKSIWPYLLTAVDARRPSSRPDLFWELLGKKRPEGYDTAPALAKLTAKQALKAILIEAITTDDEDCRMCQGPDHFRATHLPTYLQFLKLNGYTLSDHEKKLLA